VVAGPGGGRVMKAASWPRDEADAGRMLAVDVRSGALDDLTVRDLPRRLRRGDLLVLNDSATLPASLRAHAEGEVVEVRLVAALDDGTWAAALLGAGDWRQRTEDRAAPPRLPVGSTLTFTADGSPLRATVAGVSGATPRLVRLQFDRGGDALWPALYRAGRPVQYSYLRAPLALWHVQTAFASRPWSVEMPSAGRPLTWDVLAAVRGRGVGLATVTHGAGLSSTGDPVLDGALPLAERYDVPAATVAAIARARASGGRVIAVGTTAVRALEGAAAANGGALAAGEGWTSLRIDARFRPRVVAGILTGVHTETETHFDLLRGFAPEPLLERALAHAEQEGYLAHEFGDSMLVVSS
jgi:S-adenosylmethionine:tRNA ribosyltransferase-isomerase